MSRSRAVKIEICRMESFLPVIGNIPESNPQLKMTYFIGKNPLLMWWDPTRKR